MRGRKRTPTEVLKARGTLRKPRAEPQASGELRDLPAPDWMTESQKETWRDAIRCAPANVLKHIDASLLAVWVAAEDRHRQAMIAQAALDAAAEHPLLIRGRGGSLVPSPLLRVMHQAAETMVRVGSELGFTPTSRARLTSTPARPPEPNSPWARLRLLQGGKDDDDAPRTA